MKNIEEIDYNYLKKNNLILYEVITGSIAYGTNLPTSDIDKRYVYILPLDNIMSDNTIQQVNDKTNDVVGYEIGRFIELLYKANPNILEMLYTPNDCIIYKNPLFDKLLNHRDIFITKRCKDTFGGYSMTQVSKAKGKDKKQNWSKEKMIRRTPIDFCYILRKEKTYPLKKFLKDNNYSENKCGLVNLPNAKGDYALFYDYDNTKDFKGIQKENSNQLKSTSIEKNLNSNYFIGYINYNQEGYVSHCKDYNSYQTWLKERNEQRWIDVQNHNQKIDGKNMMHCQRLIDVAIEIGKGQGINVRRENANELLNIRKGKVNLESIINNVENKISELNDLFDKSTLPKFVDKNKVDNILLNIRKDYYNI